jgi:hypothetical protein
LPKATLGFAVDTFRNPVRVAGLRVFQALDVAFGNVGLEVKNRFAVITTRGQIDSRSN